MEECDELKPTTTPSVHENSISGGGCGNNNRNKEQSQNNQKKPAFICGVIEGFYGRPWTTEQRKDLFRK